MEVMVLIGEGETSALVGTPGVQNPGNPQGMSDPDISGEDGGDGRDGVCIGYVVFSFISLQECILSPD
jgi:hypothetical protein